MLVRESLSRFDLLNEDFLAENILNEKFDINLLSNKAQKLAVLASMFVMFAGGRAPEVANKIEKDTVAKESIIVNMADEDFLSRDEIFSEFKDLLQFYQKDQVKEEPKILSAGAEGFIDAINVIKPGRLDTAKIAQYDQYDEDILRAVDNLKAKGEDPNKDLIKAIMLIETGMNPTTNKWGFSGFPQTKQHTIDGINKRYKTDFTMDDMFDAEKSAEFIHYYLKAASKSDYVDNLADLIIAYNWGLGNLGKYKRGEKELSQQAADYVKMVDVMQDYFTS
jgi:hypothetical protein